ncbi:hypothetical protein NQZ68_008896 [Dissostichus eleginoides]|nr:hypothetical protein NQZ68_008896 [Dissostichus eleginoides]
MKLIEIPIPPTSVPACHAIAQTLTGDQGLLQHFSPSLVGTEACQLGKITSVNTQRRVTFHLPDGSQESCSDSGLGDQEPSSTASTTQPLPLSFPQEEYYEQTSPNSRTEGDGNSDPESILVG